MCHSYYFFVYHAYHYGYSYVSHVLGVVNVMCVGVAAGVGVLAGFHPIGHTIGRAGEITIGQD